MSTTSSYNFDEKGRIPVRPLSKENDSMAIIREFIIDYENYVCYIKGDDGKIINISSSPAVMEEISKHLVENPDVVTNVIIKNGNNEDITISAAFAEIYKLLKNTSNISIDDTLSKSGMAADSKAVGDKFSRYLYAEDDGVIKTNISLPAMLKLLKFLTVRKLTVGLANYNSVIELTLVDDDNEEIAVEVIKLDNINKQMIVGNSSTGPIYFGNSIVLNSNQYGSELPETGVEGQIFFKLIDE